MASKISEEGLAFLERREGKEHHVYKDVAGYPTIGVGHLLTASERSSGKIEIGGCMVRYADGLSDNEVRSLLDQDLDRFEKAVRYSDPGTPGHAYKQHEFDALVSFAFNVGVSAFKGSTLLKKIKAGASDREIRVQFMRWVYSGGRIVQGLHNRRTMEADLFIDGKYV